MEFANCVARNKTRSDFFLELLLQRAINCSSLEEA